MKRIGFALLAAAFMCPSFASAMTCEILEYSELKDMNQEDLTRAVCYAKSSMDGNHKIMIELGNFAVEKDYNICSDQYMKAVRAHRAKFGGDPMSCEEFKKQMQSLRK